MHKRLKTIGLTVGGVLVVAAVIMGSVFIALHTAKQPGDCSGSTGRTYVMVIQNDVVQPQRITAARCDTLTIRNDDDVSRLIAFGNHDHHVAYDGVTEKVLIRGASLSVRLNATGEYHFHDHEHDEVQGYFTVED